MLSIIKTNIHGLFMWTTLGPLKDKGPINMGDERPNGPGLLTSMGRQGQVKIQFEASSVIETCLNEVASTYRLPARCMPNRSRRNNILDWASVESWICAYHLLNQETLNHEKWRRFQFNSNSIQFKLFVFNSI